MLRVCLLLSKSSFEVLTWTPRSNIKDNFVATSGSKLFLSPTMQKNSYIKLSLVVSSNGYTGIKPKNICLVGVNENGLEYTECINCGWGKFHPKRLSWLGYNGI